MFAHKKGYSSGSIAKVLSNDETSNLLASPHIIERLNKHAKTVQALAPKSDDFLYFSIIFLKAAEASLINEYGDLRAVGSEKAWGYWDDNYKWHGNVKPHRNNNGDIFPESELKKAARDWIGTPLCVDHKSDSVDGIRGIILDTYYDEKLKQVVGLCALDKVNYPDLARKVSTGVVRFGSMGTAVEISVCTECQQQAKTAKDYCGHILNRSAWGEVNIGLKPIEYSLVVQPAEPGAILLRCFASIGTHKDELQSYGLKDVNTFIKGLNTKQADSLDRLLNSVCGSGGCSIQQRKGVVTAFINHNGGMVKSAALSSEQSAEVSFAEALAEIKSATGQSPEQNPDLYEPVYRAFGREFPVGETFTSPDATVSDRGGPATIVSPKDSEGTADYTGTGGNTTMMAGVTPPSNSFGETGGVGPESYAFASEKNKTTTIATIKEEIMNESRLRKRAEMRRKVAYHFGGSEGVEPKGTYKDESATEKKTRELDKQMQVNPKNLGGADEMVPGDKEIKEKQKRANVSMKDRVNKQAYYFGGSDGVEPTGTYKSEDYHKYWEGDKQMHVNPKNLGGTDGMVPGDKEIKEKQKRASYSGPALKTRFTQRRNIDGTINKAASKFEVFAGDKLVIATTASSIYGNKLNKYWDFLVSPEYGKKVVASIRENGVKHVAQLLTKSAQDMPAGLPGEEMGAAPMEAAPMEAASAPMEDLGLEEMSEEDVGGGDPKSVIEETFSAIEDAIAEAQEALKQLGDNGGIEINVGDVGGDDAEKLALSRNIIENLKVAVSDADQSADELAMISDTYDKYHRLTAKQKAELNSMTRLALKDSAEIIGETRALLSIAHTVANSFNKVAEYSEPARKPSNSSAQKAAPAKTGAKKVATKMSDEDTLISEALELRKRRRQALIAKAMEEEKVEEEDMSSSAHDGVGQHPTKSNVTTNTAEEIATKQPSGSVTPGKSSGGPNVSGDASYKGTPSRQLAEQSKPQINHADDSDDSDDGDVDEAVEEVVEDAVEKHEDDMHGKASDSTVTAKVKQAFLQKKASEEREKYRIKLRRAYDVSMEMQRKGMILSTKAALDRQVDEVMSFDDNAFEAFKRSVANMRPIENVKTASDLNGINVGTHDEGMNEQRTSLQVQLENIGWS
jgi:hypothetical protein